MERLPVKRTSNFKWDSRKELYDYFIEKYDLSKEQIDDEINKARETFGIRKGEVIRPQELWQKAGRALEDKLGL